MPRQIIAAKGTKLQHATVVSMVTTWTDIAGVISITPPPKVMGSKDNTELADNCKKTGSTIPDPGTCGLKIHYDPSEATQALLDTCFAAGDARTESWRIALNDQGTGSTPTTIAFPGWVQSLAINETTTEENIVADVVIQLTDMPVTTPRA